MTSDAGYDVIGDDWAAARRRRALRTAYLICDDPGRAEQLAEAALARPIGRGPQAVDPDENLAVGRALRVVG